jgi:hypothetical protein
MDGTAKTDSGPRFMPLPRKKRELEGRVLRSQAGAERTATSPAWLRNRFVFRGTRVGQNIHGDNLA